MSMNIGFLITRKYNHRVIMYIIEKSIWIDCIPEDAFELHSNHANRLDWHDHVTRSEMVTPPPLDVGSRFEVDVIAAK